MVTYNKVNKYVILIRKFSTNVHSNQFIINLNNTSNVRITISSLSPYEINKTLKNNEKKHIYDWEIDTKRINLDIKATRYDFIGLGIGPLDFKLIDNISNIDSTNRNKTSKIRMAVSTFGHFIPIVEQIKSLKLLCNDIGRNKICEMCSFGEATRQSPKELLYFFHHIATTRNRDRNIKNWSLAIKDTMPTFYSAIVLGNANYIAYNTFNILKNRNLPNIDKCKSIYNMLLVVEQPCFDHVNQLLKNNLQHWLDSNAVFDDELQQLTSVKTSGWYYFFSYGVILPIFISSLTFIYFIYNTFKNYYKDGIVSISGRVDQIDREDFDDVLVIDAEFIRDEKCKAFSRKERRDRKVIWDYPYKGLFKESRSIERD